jgi:hypothetical protein
VTDTHVALAGRRDRWLVAPHVQAPDATPLGVQLQDHIIVSKDGNASLKASARGRSPCLHAARPGALAASAVCGVLRKLMAIRL